jgi:rRNA maturation RNase YbeY
LTSADHNIELLSWEGIPEKYYSHDDIRSWLISLADNFGKTIDRLTYKFCSDQEILEINRQFLNHDYHTDIITFPESQGPGDIIRADILISWERIQDNAQDYGTPSDLELLRVIAHGLMHLIGFGDKTTAEQKKMREMEEWAIGMWGDE